MAAERHTASPAGAGVRGLRLISHPSPLILLAAALLLASCGFQLRGAAPMPFNSLYVQAAPTSPLAAQLKRAVRATGGTRIAERADQADVVLQIMSELQDKEILTLSGAGRVSEYQIRYRVAFRLTDAKNREHIPRSEIVLRREYSFNADQALSAEADEALLLRDMRSDAVQQLVRRLQNTKLQS